MTQYTETLDDIKETMGIVPGFMKALPEDALIHEWPVWKKYTLEESEIPEKYRELMGLAVAANIKCPYCLFFHQTLAKAAGATEDELAETAMIAGLTSRWSAMLHAQRYDLGTLEKEGQKMGEYLNKKSAKSKKR
ncbi:MAG TPA: carboxymuconolactone decarboxylase family protein [Methanomassiliicoccales archaeon]|nr:carboxymuconolactone decarboxylase family protein [Methanomassiliicoccales archaeon]